MNQITRRSWVFCSSAVLLPFADEPSWSVRVTSPKEPGEKLIIRGRVLRSPNGPPVPGVRLLVYQTDAGGIYGEKQGSPLQNARLRGEFTTGANGQYEIVTIRPGAYPGGQVPAHIHVNILESGRAPREIFEFLFEGDPNLTPQAKGYRLKLNKDSNGVWHATQDVALTGAS